MLAHRFQDVSSGKIQPDTGQSINKSTNMADARLLEALTIFTPFISLKIPNLGGFLNRYIKKYSFPCNLYRLIRVGDSWDSRGDGFIDDDFDVQFKDALPVRAIGPYIAPVGRIHSCNSFGSPSYSG